MAVYLLVIYIIRTTTRAEQLAVVSCSKGKWAGGVSLLLPSAQCQNNTGIFEMIVGVLTNCHTQYTSDSSICIFLFNRTTIQVCYIPYR